MPLFDLNTGRDATDGGAGGRETALSARRVGEREELPTADPSELSSCLGRSDDAAREVLLADGFVLGDLGFPVALRALLALAVVPAPSNEASFQRCDAEDGAKPRARGTLGGTA